MVVPVSDGNFAFGENVFDKLEKFGFAIVFSLEEALYGGANVPGVINVSWCIAECFVMGLEFDVYRKWFGEVGIMEGMGGAIVRLKETSESECCFVVPVVINEGECTYALGPKPHLSVALSDWGRFKMTAGCEENSLEKNGFA